jgi:hypothetical protein
MDFGGVVRIDYFLVVARAIVSSSVAVVVIVGTRGNPQAEAAQKGGHQRKIE